MADALKEIATKIDMPDGKDMDMDMAKDMVPDGIADMVPDGIADMVPGIDAMTNGKGEGKVNTQKTVSAEEFGKDIDKLLDEDTDIQNILNGLYSDLEKAFYNIIIKDKAHNMIYSEITDFIHANCINDDLVDTAFSEKFMNSLIDTMCEKAMTEEYKLSIITLITNGINISLYNNGFPYRVMHFNNEDLITSEWDTLTHTQKEIEQDKEIDKHYGGIINISTKDI